MEKPRRLAAELGEITLSPLVVTSDGTAVVVGTYPIDLHDYRPPYPSSLAVVPLDGGALTIVPLPEGLLIREVIRRSGPVA